MFRYNRHTGTHVRPTGTDVVDRTVTPTVDNQRTVNPGTVTVVTGGSESVVPPRPAGVGGAVAGEKQIVDAGYASPAVPVVDTTVVVGAFLILVVVKRTAATGGAVTTATIPLRILVIGVLPEPVGRAPVLIDHRVGGAVPVGLRAGRVHHEGPEVPGAGVGAGMGPVGETHIGVSGAVALGAVGPGVTPQSRAVNPAAAMSPGAVDLLVAVGRDVAVLIVVEGVGNRGVVAGVVHRDDAGPTSLGAASTPVDVDARPLAAPVVVAQVAVPVAEVDHQPIPVLLTPCERIIIRPDIDARDRRRVVVSSRPIPIHLEGVPIAGADRSVGGETDSQPVRTPVGRPDPAGDAVVARLVGAEVVVDIDEVVVLLCGILHIQAHLIVARIFKFVYCCVIRMAVPVVIFPHNIVIGIIIPVVVVGFRLDVPVRVRLGGALVDDRARPGAVLVTGLVVAVGVRPVHTGVMSGITFPPVVEQDVHPEPAGQP